MNRLATIWSHCKQLIKSHPFIFGATICFGLAILILRRLHYRFIVHPNIYGRYNKTNSFEYQHPRNRSMESEDIEVKTSDNITLRGWYIKQANPEFFIVYYHQNAGNIGGRLYFIESLMKNIRANVLIIAYRGFSESDGQSEPTESDIMTDSKAILDHGKALAKLDKLPLFILGRSLGGAASINTLSQPEFKYGAKGLILENTFTSIFDVAKNIIPAWLFLLYPVLWMITAGSYNSITKIPNVHIPILFVKGCKDTLIPKVQMDQLQSLYSNLKRENFSLEVKEGTHNDTWAMGGKTYFQTLKEFMVHCVRQ